jgi:hypothetical protein
MMTRACTPSQQWKICSQSAFGAHAQNNANGKAAGECKTQFGREVVGFVLSLAVQQLPHRNLVSTTGEDRLCRCESAPQDCRSLFRDPTRPCLVCNSRTIGLPPTVPTQKESDNRAPRCKSLLASGKLPLAEANKLHLPRIRVSPDAADGRLDGRVGGGGGLRDPTSGACEVLQMQRAVSKSYCGI